MTATLSVFALLALSGTAYCTDTDVAISPRNAATDQINAYFQKIQTDLKERDPWAREKIDIHFLGIHFDVDSISLSGFSNFQGNIDIDEETGDLNGKETLGEIDFDVENFVIKFGLIKVLDVKQIRVEIGGFTITENGLVDGNGNYLDDLSILLQLGDIKGSVTFGLITHDQEFSMDFANIINFINNVLEREQNIISNIIKAIINVILSHSNA